MGPESSAALRFYNETRSRRDGNNAANVDEDAVDNARFGEEEEEEERARLLVQVVFRP